MKTVVVEVNCSLERLFECDFEYDQLKSQDEET